MKSLSRVVWSEGMFLSPQHFQAQSRFYEDTIDFVIRELWPEPWGLLHARFDEDALRNGRVLLLEATGIFEDGMAFSQQDLRTAVARPADELLLPADAGVVLHLAVAKRDAGVHRHKAEASGTTENRGPRLRAVPRLVRDETNGVDEYEVAVGESNLQLLSERELSDSLSTVPVARLLRDGRGGLVYDTEFIAPTLRISASQPLMLLVKRLLETLAERIQSLSRATQRTVRFESGSSALDVASYWFLHALSSAAPVLRHLYATRHAHPEELFVELSRLAGALSTFGTVSGVDELPSYDHRNPGESFHALDSFIRQHLEIVTPSNTVSLQFSPSEPYIREAEVADERCLRRARWIFGIRADMGESDLVNSVPRLVKICSARFVPELVRRALPGLRLTHLPVPPSTIRAQADKQYFVVETTGPCWEHILQTRRVGVYAPGEIVEADFDLTVVLETNS
jgi:type VI secretion system protein ImpJ